MVVLAYESTIDNAIPARSVVVLAYASTIEIAVAARSAVVLAYASTTEFARSARNAVARLGPRQQRIRNERRTRNRSHQEPDNLRKASYQEHARGWR